MANYHGRRAPNVSQYINNLNTIPSAADMAAQQDFSNFDDDLSLFTNTQFFDFDMNENAPELPADIGFDAQNGGRNMPNNKPMGFVNQPQMSYNDFSFNPNGPPTMNHASPHSLPTSPPNGMPFANGHQQSQPTVPSVQHFAQHQFQSQMSSSPQIGDKRNSTTASLSATQDLEDVSRAAAEEDKRRRNTAASARFRVKKKQREQALEKTAKEMSDKVQILEARVGQLEMENKWLKGLITEKNIRKGAAAAAKKAEAVVEDESEDVQVKLPAVEEKEEVAASKSEADNVGDVESSLDEKKRGVGTEAAEAVEV